MEIEQKRVNDIGKMLIPLEVLNKEGKLSDSEYELIKEHPVFGSNALKSSKSLKHIAKYVRHHHERVDGKGYPDNLFDGEIPVESKILCLVDTWDAMTRNRSYRKALSKEVAKKELIKNKGKQFDEKLVDHFIKFIEEK